LAIDVYSQYQPLPWQIKAHAEEWVHGCFVGGKGGGKTRFVVEEFLASALDFPGSTWLVGRKTLPSLKDTTMKEFLSAVPEQLIKSFNKTDRNLVLMNDSSFIFRSLDDPKKFESLQISGFAIDEADEIEKETYDTLKSRVRQMIRGKQPRYRSALILNPCDETHWIPTIFQNNPPKGHKLFYCSTMDNMENLPQGYVEELQSIYTPDMQQRMIHGMFGKVHRGRPVYHQFKNGNYIVFAEPDPKETIYRSWDFGYNHPAIIWFQFLNGRMTVLAELMGKKVYLDDFIRDHVMPTQSKYFPEHKIFRDFCDPRGSDESDKGRSSVDVLHDFGIYPMFRRTSIAEGIKCVRALMDTQDKDRIANFAIHPRCKITIEGLRGGYHREDDSEDPVKDDHYDHLQDCLRYGAIHMYRRWKANRLQQAFDGHGGTYHPVTGRFVE
jgi:hypothetical protein